MALPEIGQAEMLASTFAALLQDRTSPSAAIVGCAGGNGFQAAAEAGVTRLVGRDINPAYIETPGRVTGSSSPCRNSIVPTSKSRSRRSTLLMSSSPP